MQVSIPPSFSLAAYILGDEERRDRTCWDRAQARTGESFRMRETETAGRGLRGLTAEGRRREARKRMLRRGMEEVVAGSPVRMSEWAVPAMGYVVV
ncbi:hypothetical protein SESBI_04499 [Sesbania bispinosa]|nr:hypothetical protein SESBI_04499 [Sesbania bispinosa]